MKTTGDLEHAAASYTPLPDHPKHPSSAAAPVVPRRLLIKVLSGFAFVSLLFLSAFVLSNQQGPSYSTVKKSPLPGSLKPEKSSAQLSSSTDDRLSWERTVYHFQPVKNFIYDPNACFMLIALLHVYVALIHSLQWNFCIYTDGFDGLYLVLYHLYAFTLNAEDTNGPLYYKGWYHLFYQYNPYAPVWGNMSWGHAVSKDMVNWFELPVALGPSEWYDTEGVLSGSTTLLPNGEIFALYTGNANDFSQLQCKAYPANVSDPLLVEWVKYEGNPILYTPPGIGIKDYRDPSTVWKGPDGKYRMVMGSKINRTGFVYVYHTEDFTHYTQLDEPLHSVPNTDMWECVDFYPVSTTDDYALAIDAYGPGMKHVIKESWEGHGMDYYSIGTYDAFNDKWTPDDPELDVGIGLRCDYGKFFASKSLYDPIKKRRVTWGYVAESDNSNEDISRGWATIYNVPRTVVLDRKTGNHLLHWPVEEVEDLRSDGREFEEVELKPGSIIPLDVGSATQLDIVGTFEVDEKELKVASDVDVSYGCTTSGGSATRGVLGPFGMAVLADKDLSELTSVYFYLAKNADGVVTTHFCSDKLRSSLDYDGERVVYGSTVPVLKDEKLTMRLLVDHSIVEGFAQGGRTVITSRVYPTKAIYDGAKLFVFNNATGISVKASLKIWHMGSAKIQPYPF